MMEQQENSSLPLLLAISGTVVLIVAIGWLLLDQNTPSEIVPDTTEQLLPQDTGIAEPDIIVPVTDIEASFRMARLAAEADILAYPPERSALHFYGRILSIEPDNAIAKAELEGVLGRISETLSDHLAAREYNDAYDLALLVARVRPGHPLVFEAQQSLDDLAAEFVGQALQQAQDGDDKAAVAALSAAEAMPGRQPNYFRAVRASLAEIRSSRSAAESQRTETERLDAARAVKLYTGKVRGAIESGQLITPAGESARDYLAEPNESDELKAQLTDELLAALVAASQESIELSQLPAAETLLDAADELVADDPELVALRELLEQAFIDAESSRLVSTNDLVRVNNAKPRYPRQAAQRSITGWVDVTFTVTSSGETDNVAAVRSEPPSIFDKVAVEAVEKWTFEPRSYRGQLIDQQSGVRLVFQVE